MKIKTVTFGISRSIKMADFKYYKVDMAMEATIADGDAIEPDIKILKEVVREELQKAIDEEKQFYRNQTQITQFKAMMLKYDPESAEYALAKEKLVQLETGKLG